MKVLLIICSFIFFSLIICDTELLAATDSVNADSANQFPMLGDQAGQIQTSQLSNSIDGVFGGSINFAHEYQVASEQLEIVNNFKNEEPVKVYTQWTTLQNTMHKLLQYYNAVVETTVYVPGGKAAEIKYLQGKLTGLQKRVKNTWESIKKWTHASNDTDIKLLQMALNMNHCKKLIIVGDLQKAIIEYDETVKLWEEGIENSHKKQYANPILLNSVKQDFSFLKMQLSY